MLKSNGNLGLSEAMIAAAKEILEKKLTPKQEKNIDKNHNGKIDAQDFKLLKKKKSEMKEENLDEKNWIKGAIKHPGAMTAAAEREGVSNSKYEQEHKHDSGKAGQRARLALTLKKMQEEEVDQKGSYHEEDPGGEASLIPHLKKAGAKNITKTGNYNSGKGGFPHTYTYHPKDKHKIDKVFKTYSEEVEVEFSDAELEKIAAIAQKQEVE